METEPPEITAPLSTAGATVTAAVATTSTDNPRKRPGEVLRRGKRGKYTTVACDECKKRKLKCIPMEAGSCQRCANEALHCVYAQCRPTARDKTAADRSADIQQLQLQLRKLQEQVAVLETVVHRKEGDIKVGTGRSPGTSDVPLHSPASSSQHRAETVSSVAGVPKEPQFVGPTRSAFGILIGERSLTRMGIPAFDPPPASGAQTPEEQTEPTAEPTITTTTMTSTTTAAMMTTSTLVSSTSAREDYWQTTTADETVRLLGVFQEQVESVYPVLNISEQAGRIDEILATIRTGGGYRVEDDNKNKDVELVEVATATALVLEAHGKTELSTAMVQAVEARLPLIARPQVSLADVQLLAILSTYYFHCDDELLAWRTIGIAAREALELGLHRRKSLFDNFPCAADRRLAVRVFWCVYVLDRRWSFGTSLSFALVDRDIDPVLPEPDSEFAYLKCMLGYGRLSSKVWDAMPPLGAPSQHIPDDTVAILDANAKQWLASIPADLQLRHPRLALAPPPQSQPQVVQRLRTLLYLRGNYIRTLIYRHHLLTPQSIASRPRCARLVVDIAQDSIQVLVHLHATSDLYSGQQNVFHHFLLGALSIIFLAVCHAPDIFAVLCRNDFLDAVELVRGFSRHSSASRRLWNSIRGLLPRIKMVGWPHVEQQQQQQSQSQSQLQSQTQPQTSVTTTTPTLNTTSTTSATATTTATTLYDIPDLEMAPIPDMFQVSNDLLSLFDAFGQGQGLSEEQLYANHEFDFETSRRFQGLL